MRSMTRSILVTEIFIKATEARSAAGDDNAALTLMSTDLERINLGLRPLHDIWASTIQAALAGWMLYNQLGTVFVTPMGLVIICVTCLAILMKFTGDSQRAWMVRFPWPNISHICFEDSLFWQSLQLIYFSSWESGN